MTTSQRVVDAFTEMASHYEQTVDRELRQFWGVGYQEFIGCMLDKMDAAGARTVLDVATGRGVIPLALALRPAWQARIVGVDITPEMLRGAQRQVAQAGGNARVVLVCGSGMWLPFAGESFDVVTCALATHHMHLPSLLNELRRVLRPGGQLLVADVALATFWRSCFGRLVLHALARWYGRREGTARMRAELDALPNMRTPDQGQESVTASGFCDTELTAIPARRRWYPPGILISARSDPTSGS
jgi:ubiquinone/menaquinone biosynthesis C-methylase UbiE